MRESELSRFLIEKERKNENERKKIEIANVELENVEFWKNKLISSVAHALRLALI